MSAAIKLEEGWICPAFYRGAPWREVSSGRGAVDEHFESLRSHTDSGEGGLESCALDSYDELQVLRLRPLPEDLCLQRIPYG